MHCRGPLVWALNLEPTSTHYVGSYGGILGVAIASAGLHLEVAAS